MPAEVEKEGVAGHDTMRQPPHPGQDILPRGAQRRVLLVVCEAQDPLIRKAEPEEQAAHACDVIEAALELHGRAGVVHPNEQRPAAPRRPRGRPAHGSGAGAHGHLRGGRGRLPGVAVLSQELLPIQPFRHLDPSALVGWRMLLRGWPPQGGVLELCRRPLWRLLQSLLCRILPRLMRRGVMQWHLLQRRLLRLRLLRQRPLRTHILIRILLPRRALRQRWV
mmetsp:Transcript_45119/g.134848  ORF Transcript_45119/g.134848 Transcript_45119/m.134848 type:complete len:222 (+) Transcript_45119:679-1344(+)